MPSVPDWGLYPFPQGINQGGGGGDDTLPRQRPQICPAWCAETQRRPPIRRFLHFRRLTGGPSMLCPEGAVPLAAYASHFGRRGAIARSGRQVFFSGRGGALRHRRGPHERPKPKGWAPALSIRVAGTTPVALKGPPDIAVRRVPLTTTPCEVVGIAHRLLTRWVRPWSSAGPARRLPS